MSERSTKDLSEAETLSLIRKYVNNPPERSVVFTITPNIAKALLEEYNSGNRPKKMEKIARYAKDMTNGGWALTGDTIKFSDKRLLRDGQNRLMACFNSGKPFTTHVVFGISDGYFTKMDIGKNRTPADVLTIAGYKNASALGSIARWHWLFTNDMPKSRDTLSPEEVLKWVQDHPKLADVAGRVSGIAQKLQEPAGPLGALYVIASSHDSRKAAQFLDAFDTRSGPAASVVSKLMDAIARVKAQSSGRIHDIVRAAFYVIAWNLFIEGRRGSLSQFKYNPAEDGDPFPEIE